ncbi:MAG TPA: adenosine kinase [Micavibrio sp.]|nr:adenosine kinase [Micavibrio sp.]
MSFDFCGIGNACIDIVARVDEAFLDRWKLTKSICTYLPLERADAMEAALPAPDYIPGGCGANTAAVISALGGKSAFIGRVAADRIGEMFLRDMAARNIHHTGKPDTNPGAGSTRIFALITPDTERSFAAYYGVQENLSEEDVDGAIVSQSSFMYLDGYALNSRRGIEAFLKAAEISKKAGNIVVFSPSDLSILQKYPQAVESLCRVSDMALCNQQEAQFMTGTDNLPDSLNALRSMFKSGAVTAGADGAYVFDNVGIRQVPAATPPGPVFDTNGAGDAFAGGLIFGLASGYDIEKAARLGNRCAAGIITHTGARPVHDCTTYLADL